MPALLVLKAAKMSFDELAKPANFRINFQSDFDTFESRNKGVKIYRYTLTHSNYAQRFSYSKGLRILQVTRYKHKAFPVKQEKLVEAV